MSRRHAYRQGRQRGLAIVEFTIVVAILLMLIMATAEFARVFLQYNTLTKSVRDSARHVAGRALFGSTGTVTISAGLTTEAKNLAVYGNIFGTGPTLLPGLTTGDVTVIDAGGNTIRVTASYPYGSIFSFVPGFVYGPNVSASAFTLQTAVTMRAL
jgi:Flp pilus assembly protein TadG